MRYQELLYKWLFIWLIFVRFKEQHHEEFLNQLVYEKSYGFSKSRRQGEGNLKGKKRKKEGFLS